MSDIGCLSEVVTEEQRRCRSADMELKVAWRDYVSRYRWDAFLTLTASLWTPEQLLRAFREYVRHLTRAVQGKVRYFVVVEIGASGTAHLHALLSGTAALRPALLERKWRPGFAQAARYDERRGAAAYITKDMLRNADEWAFSEKMPPLRLTRGDAEGKARQ